MSKILFATAHVLTSQGWFQPANLLPQLDLPEEEIQKLIAEKSAAECEHDSPLAARLHVLAKDPNKHLAADALKLAVNELSPESPGDEPIEIDSDWVDPTPPGKFPTLENYVKAGYEASNYEKHKAEFLEAKSAEQQRRQIEAAQAKVAQQRQIEAEAKPQSKAVAGENPGSHPVDTTEPPTT